MRWFFKPLGDIFINAMFMVVVPLVFTTICSAVSTMSSMERLGKVMRSLVVVFLITGAIAAAHTGYCHTVPAGRGHKYYTSGARDFQALKTADQIVKAFTVDDFVNLLFAPRHAAAYNLHYLLWILPPSHSEKEAERLSEALLLSLTRCFRW